MATAEELLNSLSDTETYSDDPGIFVINDEDRTIDVPSNERLFGVTGDKDVERKYFQCPKIVGDNIDLSQHQIYISYVFTTSENNTIFPTIGNGRYHCEDVKVSGDNITFSWLLSGNVLSNPGFIAFKVMAMKNEGDELKTKWNTAAAFGTVLITVPDGEDIAEEYPDVINQIFDRLDALESGGGGGTGGTTNYENLSNKPQLNGVTLEGNKTLDQVGVLAKNQGSSNSGKYLSVGSDGNVVPTDAPSGGTVDPEQIKQAVNGYLEENPVSGMTAEQEQQLNQNTQDVADLKSALPDKLDTNQGAENKGKSMVVGEDGGLVPENVKVNVDSTLSNEGEAADAKVTGEALNSKAKNAGWNPEKIIGTDTEGNMIDMDVSQLDIKNLIFKSEDGKKYSVSVDNDGNVGVKRQYEMPTDGLVLNVYVKDGEVYDSVQDGTFSAGTVLSDTDFEISQYKISEESFDEFTYVALFNFQKMKSHSGIMLSENANWNKCMRWQYGNRINLFGLVKNTGYTWDSVGNEFKANIGVINDIVSKNGYMCVAFSFKKDGTISVYQDGVHSLWQQSEEALPFNGPTIGYFLTGHPYQRICFYNRALSDEELYAVSQILKPSEYVPLPSATFKNGLVGLSSPTAFAKIGGNTPYYIDTDTSVGEKTKDISGIERTWENSEYSPIEVTDDVTGVEELLWTHIKDEIEVDDIFACEAYPYPYNIYATKYNVEYESSEPDTIECIKGVLFAKKPGKSTITAKLSNSELSCTKEINVIEKPTITENFLYLSENYSNGINSLINDNPRSVAIAIKMAIQEASEAGYNGIVFPKKEYNVRFDDCDSENIFIQVPSDFIIDFNGSIWNIQERADIATRGVKLFRFGRRKDKEEGAEGTYGDWELCQNSIVRNLVIYGERFFKEYEKAEVKGDQLALFTVAAKNCKLENIYANGMTGWLTDVQCNGYAYWTGKGDGDNRRGRTLYTDYVPGKLNEMGTEVIQDPTGKWYCTPEYLKLGYIYGKDSIKSNEMDKYLFGFMGFVTYGNSGRWYDIYFFDEEKELISYNPKQFGLEPYQLPEKAVYFKVNVPFGEAPTKNSGEDNCLIRLFPYTEAEHIVYDNCKFVNPQYTSFSMTGGRDCIIRNCYCEQGLYADWGWAIDWEDGWQDMRHNIHYKTIVKGNVVFPGSHHNCILDCFITNNFNVTQDTEDVVFVNNVVNGARIQAKTNNSIMYNYYNGTWSLTTVNAGVNRESNNEKVSDFNNYIT